MTADPGFPAMTDRRQEAIKELRQIRQDMDKRHVPWKIGHWAEYVYDRLAALREFPEEEFRRFARRYREADERMLLQGDRGILADYTFQQMIADFKRLWLGQEAPMEPEPLIDHRRFKGAKGGCLKCKGSGNDPIPATDGTLFTCPDCKGTGERRKGEQRKDTGKRDYDRANHTKDIDGCAPQYETLKGKTLDRRLSEERRK